MCSPMAFCCGCACQLVSSLLTHKQEIFSGGQIPYTELSNKETVQFVLSGKRLDVPAGEWFQACV